MDRLAGCVARRSTSIQGELGHAMALNPIKADTIRESQVGGRPARARWRRPKPSLGSAATTVI
jgi:hypothetical protein